MTWQYQLEDPVDTRVNADAFDVDAFSVDASVVKALHHDGKRAICYVNVGANENRRPDVARFPKDVIGDPLDGWPGEFCPVTKPLRFSSIGKPLELTARSSLALRNF